MEKKDDSEIVSDDQFLALLHAAKSRDSNAMLELIELFKEDITRISKYIFLPKEDAVSQIILEFLEFIQNDEI